MDKFFSVFGKVILILLILGVIGAGAYYLGQKSATKNSQNQSTAVSTTKIPDTPTPTIEAMKPSPTTTISSRKSISAGIPKWSLYVLSIPTGWTNKEESNESAQTDKLTLTKNSNTLVISQGAGGGGSCTYGSEPSQEMGQHFDSFIGITGFNNQFRRGTNDAGKTYQICEKGSGGYGFPTTFGYITYNISSVSDSILVEMDSIVASILKQH